MGHAHDPETKRRYSQWKSPEYLRPMKAGQVRSKVEVLLIVL
jgi:hypothetical protein